MYIDPLTVTDLDSLFPYLSSRVQAPTVFPLSCYGLFALRDGLTVTSSFVLKVSWKKRGERWREDRIPPSLVRSMQRDGCLPASSTFFPALSCPRPLPALFPCSPRTIAILLCPPSAQNTIKERLEAEHGLSHNNADLAASFAVPMIAQLASTPLHILSLDIYSHPESPFRMRMKEIAKGYMSVCSGRVLRIIPAFGVGGYLNDQVKESFEERENNREGKGVVIVPLSSGEERQ
jgi:hypothetical protein